MCDRLGSGPHHQIGEETVITVDAKAAGKGKVTCKVSTPDGAELDVDVVENADGTFDIYYTAPEPGEIRHHHPLRRGTHSQQSLPRGGEHSAGGGGGGGLYRKLPVVT